MDKQNKITTQAEREDYVYKFLDWAIEDVFLAQFEDFRRPPFRISFGMPPGSRAGAKSKTLGACYRRSQSKDGHNEIFINPTMDDTARVLDVALHEMIHAEDDCASGHK